MNSLALVSVGLILLAGVGTLHAQTATVLEIENIVQTARGGDGAWTAAEVDQSLAIRDRIRTRQRSRASVRLTSLYTMRMEQLTTIEISPVLLDDTRPKLDLMKGAVFLFSRELTGEIDIRTPAANGALRGTQVFVHVLDGGRTFFQTLEGSVTVSNSRGEVVIGPGEAAEAIPGQAPERTAMIDARNILQWALYYPAVIDPAEFGGEPGGTRPAGESMSFEAILGATEADLPAPASNAREAYRQGDLLHAVSLLPDGGGSLFEAAVLLAVGRLDEAEALLGGIRQGDPGRISLERMIAAVRFEELPDRELGDDTTASEAMAESYYLQSRSRLEEAREAARIATERSPGNGFAWVRLAELEFSFGRTRQAKEALARGLALAPRNARAHALLGFVLSAENRIAEARQSFERATRLDGALGTGWLGLGLTKIKRGELDAGRGDLQTAATVEPLTSVYHSYLGKAFSTEGRLEDARRDLALAIELDPDDPTPWLYSAIVSQQNNETNRAIREMQESIRLNDNRRVYRSRLLLDQDRAVRSANLARIYQANGMDEVALREAARAVQSDYTNASAHLFLANSFDSMRDPKRISLRYETPWFNELLLSQLLSPVGGGPLSQYVTHQEYSKLLEADGIGGSFVTEWRDSDTEEWRSAASVFGTSGNVSFGIDYAWRDAPGMPVRINDAAELDEVYGQVKWQATPDDVFYFLGKWSTEEHGDIFDTYDNRPLAPGVMFREEQDPGLLLGGWNHRWAPGSNTLLLAGRLAATQWLTDPRADQLLLRRDDAVLRPGLVRTVGGFDAFTDPALAGSVGLARDGVSLMMSPAFLREASSYLGRGDVLGVGAASFDFETRREFEIHTIELQHIQEFESNTLVGGARFQSGEIATTASLLVERPTFAGGFATPAVEQKVIHDFERWSAYAYDFWSPVDGVTLIGGAAWDRLEHPDNFRNPPISETLREDERVSAKAGLILSPGSHFHLRGVYTQGLGGLTFDESVRLEPVQIAGFNQAYRTVISESLVGSVEAPRFQVWGLGIDGNLESDTWWGITGQVIEQDVDRMIGAFDGYAAGLFPVSPAYFPGGTEQRLAYREESLLATVNQLLGDQWAVGSRYRVTRSDLATSFPEIPARVLPSTSVNDRALLHEGQLSLNWNSPTGLFARVEGNWFAQDLDDDPRGLAPGAAPRMGDDFWQVNAFGGYRFRRNLSEIGVGLLNIGDRDYRLSPLSPYFDLARERTFVFRFRSSF